MTATTFERHSRVWLAIVMLTALVSASLMPGTRFGPRPAAAALGGPVIIGGDDLNDHGSFSGGQVFNGWLYIRKALENLDAQVTRVNDGTVAVLGSTDSTATSGNNGGAYHYAAPLAGLAPQFVEGAAAINQFFADLAAGTKKPAILAIAGTGAGNGLSSAEGTALTSNAVAIANFVNEGGGLLAHGSGTVAFGWLSTLLPGISFPNLCDSSTLSLTPAGQAAFPGLTNTHIRAGPCHNHFTGNFGGLAVLAEDSSGTGGAKRAVILGGAAAQLPGSISLTPITDTNVIGEANSHTVTALVKNAQNQPLGNVMVTFTVTSGPNQGTTGTATTNSSGQASFTYTTNGTPGTDQIQASFVDPATGQTKTSPAVTKVWEPPANTPPTVTATGSTVNEGQAATVAGTITDPDAGQTHVVEIHWNLGPVEVINLAGGVLTFNASRTYPDDDPAGTPADTYTITVVVKDALNASGQTTAQVTVNNVAPTVNAGPAQTVYRNDLVTLSGTFTDPAAILDQPYAWTWSTPGGAPASAAGAVSYGSVITAATAYALEGTYTAVLTVADNDTGTGSGQVTITVLNRAPVCTNAAPSIGQIWPPNHKFVAVNVLGVTDPEGDVVTITITGIRQDEPVNTVGDGNTGPDGMGVGTATAQVRAERSGTPKVPGNGRVYHISFTANDGHGGSCASAVKVGVPHDQGKGSTVVDDGPLYDSTVP
ncbi:MAG: Ig-like domain-containing protein [Chloroflexi bacterium]|nr:Ig-like domain-containing protein [Chloroflexota bacterium]